MIGLDVLEHVPDPPALVGQLTRFLRPDRHLIVHAPFFYLAPSVGTHLRSNRRYSGEWRRLYGSSNLRPVAGELFWNPLALRKIGPSTTRIGIPFQVRAGGWLLGVARWWHGPHLFALTHVLGRADRRRLADRLTA